VLAEELLARVSRRYGRKSTTIPAEGRRRLIAHRWPGNVRELAHEIERAVVFGGDEGMLFPHLGGGPAAAGPLAGASADCLRPDFVFPENGFQMESAIDELVARAVKQAGGNVSAAARLLGVSRDVVRYRIKGGRTSDQVGE
jgi:transcriptional regulator with PAS, ATPase and Fis domain